MPNCILDAGQGLPGDEAVSLTVRAPRLTLTKNRSAPAKLAKLKSIRGVAARLLEVRPADLLPRRAPTAKPSGGRVLEDGAPMGI